MFIYFVFLLLLLCFILFCLYRETEQVDRARRRVNQIPKGQCKLLTENPRLTSETSCEFNNHDPKRSNPRTDPSCTTRSPPAYRVNERVASQNATDSSNSDRRNRSGSYQCRAAAVLAETRDLRGVVARSVSETGGQEGPNQRL